MYGEVIGDTSEENFAIELSLLHSSNVFVAVSKGMWAVKLNWGCWLTKVDS